jgi:hypothetical protein
VNEAIHVPRQLRREIRAIVFNCEKNGIDAEAKKWVKEQKKKKESFSGTAKNFPGYLRGIAAYLNMVQPEHGGPLLRRVNELFGGAVDHPDNTDNATGEKAGDA